MYCHWKECGGVGSLPDVRVAATVKSRIALRVPVSYWGIGSGDAVTVGTNTTSVFADFIPPTIDMCMGWALGRSMYWILQVYFTPCQYYTFQTLEIVI